MTAAAEEHMLAVETEPPVTTPPPPSSVWLAAYAMGLVASDRQDEGVEELRALVAGSIGPVVDAVRHLEDLAEGDARLRARARELLTAAMAGSEAILDQVSSSSWAAE